MKNRFGMFIHWGIYALYADHEQVLSGSHRFKSQR